MRYPRTLVLALATAGLAGIAPAAHAQFANVFVPELAVIERATALAGRASARERALDSALAKRYSATASAERSALDAAYAAAMRKAAQRHREDTEIATSMPMR